MSQQIQISGGAKVRDLQDVIIGTSGVLSSLAFNVANGVPKLDVNGKILVAQLPNSVMEYKGTWNAATNTPTLVNGTGNQGDVYLCTTAGTVDFGAGGPGPIAFVVGDQVIYSGSIWQRASGATGTVTSVAVTESGDTLNITGSPITTSGTINIGFNGTNLQYVNGAGNLTTFPILTGYVTAVSGTAPVVSSGGTTPAISMAAATGLVDGYLLATDFAIFNAKQSALTFSSPLVNTSGTISIPAATTSVNGYLASADFTTFNNKQNAITLTTTGTSGASTLVGATLNIPNYGSALTGYVPYTGATQDVDLGAFKLNAQSLHIKGTAGNGHLGLKHQSASATASANEVSLFADSLGDLSWLNGNLYLSKFITSGNTAARSYTFPNANGTVALTSDISYPVTSVFGRTGAVVATSGDYTTTQVTEGTNLYYTDVRARLALSASTGISYNNTTGVITNSAPDQTVSITAGAGISVSGTYPSFTIASTITQYTDALARLAISLTTTGSSGAATYNNTTGVLNIPQYIGGVTSVFGRTGAVVATEGDYSLTQLSDVTITSPTTGQVLKYNGTAWINDTDANTGTVTSVGLSSATSGVTIGSSPVTTSGTITLAIATATTSQNGLLSSTDWSTFNGKESVLTFSSPLVRTTNTISIPVATTSVNGYLSSTDWTTFNGKQGAITLTTTGTSGAATLVGTTLNIPQYSGGGGSITLSAIGSTPNANAATLTGSALNLEPASASFGGVVTTGLQTFAGNKNFNGQVNIGTTTTSTYGNVFIKVGTDQNFVFRSSTSIARIETVNDAVSTQVPMEFTATRYSFSGASGFVGINTTTPGSYLQVNGSAAIGYNTSTVAPSFGLAVSGNVGIGTASARTKFDLQGSGTQNTAGDFLGEAVITGPNLNPVSNASGNLFIQTNNAQGADLGGTIAFGARYNGTAEAACFGVIKGAKENATSGNLNSYLAFYTRLNGTGVLERMRITSGGNVGIGTTSPQRTFVVSDGSGGQGLEFSNGTGNGTIISYNRTTSAYGNIILGEGTNQVGIKTTTIGSTLQVNGSAAIGYSASTVAPSFGLAVSGNVGIGNTNSAGTYTIDVTGTGRFSNTLRIEKSIAYGVDGPDGYNINAVNTSTSTSKAGNIAFLGYSGNGASPYQWGLISGEKDSATGDGSYAGSLTFYTTSGGAGGESNSGVYKRLTISGTGAATFTSSVTATSFFESSDSRLKTLIQDNYQTKGIASITPKLYTKNGKVELGYYAQDFVGILDSAVSKGSDDMLSLSYREALVAKVYALEQEIKDLKAK